MPPLDGFPFELSTHSYLKQNSTCASLPSDFNFAFKNHSFLRYIFMTMLLVLYATLIYKVYIRRNTPEMTPRSPHMIIIFLMYLMLDGLGNTYLFSIDPSKKTLRVCYLGVFCTVFCQFGIMATVYLRMYRIYAVFSAYEEYLEW